MKKTYVILLVATLVLLSSCSAVFKAGVSGTVIDSDTDNGVAAVSVYAYTTASERDTDYNAYMANHTAGSLFNESFAPSGSTRAAATTTGTDGTFTVNKLVWESLDPKWGKTADQHELFLLFFHKDYGLFKNSSQILVISDSNNANSVTQSISRTRQSTSIALTIRDVATGNPIGASMNVTVKVPQSSGANPTYKTYDKNNTDACTVAGGTGTIVVTYPRYQDNTTTPFEPEIQITMVQASDEPTWKQAYNGDSPNSDYAFYDSTNKLSKSIGGSSTDLTSYVKSTSLSYPSISGRINILGATPSTSDENDSLHVWLAVKNASNQLELLGDTSAMVLTTASGDGANGSLVTHGNFTGLGNGITWDDESYTTKTLSKEIYIIADAFKNGIADAGDRYYATSFVTTEATKPVGTLTTQNMTAITAWPVTI